MKFFTPAKKTVVAASAATALTTALTLLSSGHRLAAPLAGSRAPFDLPQSASRVHSQTSLAENRRRWGSRALQRLDWLHPRSPLTARSRAEEEVGEEGASREASGEGARFPPLTSSTVMFLHIFKCAGSSLRRMLVDWAIAKGESGVIVASCSTAEREDKLCLESHELLDEPVQREIISRQKVLAGHFLWGFQRHVEGPYLMITSLRNPLEVFVSGLQFIHPNQTNTLDQAQAYISGTMRDALGIDVSENVGEPTAENADGVAPTTGMGSDRGRLSPSGGLAHRDQMGGFIFRLTGDDKTLHGEALVDATNEAMENLREFWVVGIVEQYAGFMEVLKRLLDPERKYEAFWEKYSRKHLNSSPVGSRDVLAAIDPGLVRTFNDSLTLQWQVYERGVGVWDARCREVLPARMHQELCTVMPAPSSYV